MAVPAFPSCIDFVRYADCRAGKEGFFKLACCAWCNSRSSCVTWSHWDNATFPACHNFTMFPEHVKDCAALQKLQWLDFIRVGLAILGVLAILVLVWFLYWFFFGFGLCLRRARHALDERARRRREAAWRVTVATVRRCLPCRMGGDPTNETLGYLGEPIALVPRTQAQVAPHGSQANINIQELHHDTPPASRDESLLQLQADHDWADGVDALIQGAGYQEDVSGNVYMLRIGSAPKSCRGAGAAGSEANVPVAGTEMLRKAMLQGPQFRCCRVALHQDGFNFEHASGAIMALHPSQYTRVQSLLIEKECRLHPYHILISGDLEYLLDEILSDMPHKKRPRVKDGEVGRQELDLASKSPSLEELSQDSEMPAAGPIHVYDSFVVKECRTFLSAVPVLKDEGLVLKSDAGSRDGINPRRYDPKCSQER